MSEEKNRFRSKLSFWTIASVILIIVFSTLMVPRKKVVNYHYEVNDITRSDIIAPFDFDILKQPDLIRKEKQEVIKSIPYVFRLDNDVRKIQMEKSRLFFKMASTLKHRHMKFNQSLQTLNLNRYSSENPDSLQEVVRTDSLALQVILTAFREEFKINVTEVPYRILYLPGDGNPVDLKNLRAKFLSGLEPLYSNGILDIPEDSVKSASISILHEGTEQPALLKDVYDRYSAVDLLSKSLTKDYNSYDKKVLVSRLCHMLIKPDLIYQKEMTARRQKEMISRIPLVNGKVYKDERIVDANTLITPEIYQKIYSLNVADQERNSYQNNFLSLLRMGGDLLYMCILYMTFIMILFMLNRRYVEDTNKFLLIIICMSLSLVLGSAAAVFMPGFISLVPITVSTICLLAFFDERVSLLGSITVLLVLVYIFGESFKFIILHILPIVLVIYSMKNLRARENIMRPMFFIFIGYAVGIIAISLATLPPPAKILNLAVLGVANTVLSVLLANGLLMVFEKIFGITTDLRLLELSDLNQPLLKRLSLEAVGTFNHSILVGNLLEPAAEEIGANSLLVRVGAYYHDIGKLSKPEYFIENQVSKKNKLYDLKPHMAAKVIISHVREGLEMAEKEQLPEEIKQFIATHHGTMRMDYFYDLAHKNDKSVDLNDKEFRYPGPKPTTKETALLMIVEACEAAVRSIPKPTPKNIQMRVDEVIWKRLTTGQLDECPLTLKDLVCIKKAIYPMLRGLYHQRIEYPDSKKNENGVKKQIEKTHSNNERK